MIIFDAIISDFTGGILKDVQTAVVAGLGISFLILGINIIAVRFLNISIPPTNSRDQKDFNQIFSDKKKDSENDY